MFSIKIVAADTHQPAGKLADAEIHFDHRSGPLEGLKLIGFSLWERRSANGSRNVTFPARTYSVNGERRSFALLRPSGEGPTAPDAIKDAIFAAYDDLQAGGPGVFRYDAPRATPLPAAANVADYPSETDAKTGPILEAEEDDRERGAINHEAEATYQTEAERMAAGMKAARQPGGILLSDLMPGGKYGKAKTDTAPRFAPASTPTLEF
jgi:hypothetical protein